MMIKKRVLIGHTYKSMIRNFGWTLADIVNLGAVIERTKRGALKRYERDVIKVRITVEII